MPNQTVLTVLKRPLLPVLLALASLVASCGSETERPDFATWIPAWETMVAAVPDEAALGDTPSEETCRRILGELRELETDVVPSPAMTIDELVKEWLSVAQAAFFECPPESEEIASFSDAYTEMRRVEESVKTALVDRGD